MNTSPYHPVGPREMTRVTPDSVFSEVKGMSTVVGVFMAKLPLPLIDIVLPPSHADAVAFAAGEYGSVLA